jgi:hypothetical protein
VREGEPIAGRLTDHSTDLRTAPLPIETMAGGAWTRSESVGQDKGQELHGL